MEYLKELLKKDVWNLIDSKEKQDINFESAVLHALIQSDKFVVGDAITMAEKIKNAYNKILDNVDKYINNGCLDLITILRNINKNYDDSIKPLLNRLVEMNYKNC